MGRQALRSTDDHATDDPRGDLRDDPGGDPGDDRRGLTRRTLLEWLGSGTVLTLAGALAACGETRGPGSASDSGPLGDSRGQGSDAHGSDAAAADSAPLDAAGADASVKGFPFRPANPDHDPVFNGWGERTADAQDLVAILAGWKLTVEGLVARPYTIGFAELLTSMPRTDLTADFHCVEGWSIHDVPYNGVRLAALIDRAEPLAAATHVTFHAVTGRYTESLPLAVAREPKTLAAYGIADATIPLRHGFPLRLVIPRLLGYKNIKFVERIVLDDRPRDGFWVQLGYAYDGEVPPSRLRPGKY